MHLHYPAPFMAELRALDNAARALVLSAIRNIERDPWSGRELPFPWRRGTYTHRCGGYTIMYCRDSEQDQDLIRFVYVRVTPAGAGDDPVM